MGANVGGKARRFLPYLGPEGVGGYRRKCDEIAEKATKASCSRARARAGRSTALQPNRSVNPRPGAASSVALHPSQRWRLHTRVANGPEGVRANIRDARAEIQPVQRRLRFCRRCRHPEILVPPVEQRATAATDREPAATMSPGLGSNSGQISPPHVPYSNVFRAHAAF